MQPVRKKSIPPRRRAVLLLALLFTALILLIWIFFGQKAPDAQPPLIKNTDEELTLISRDASELSKFSVRPSAGEPYAIIFRGGKAEVEGKPDFPLEEREINLMVKDLTLLTVHEELGRITQDEQNLEALGLGKTAVRVQAEYSDGTRAGLVLGGSAPTEIPSDYFMMEGDDRVFSVSTDMRPHFDRGLNTLHPVPALNFNSALTDGLYYSGEKGFEIRQSEGLWEVVSPFRYPADEDRVRSLLYALGNMRLAVYAAKADGDNLSKYGYDPARRSVRIDLAPSVIQGYREDGEPAESLDVPAQSFRFQIGDPIGSLGFYLLYEGEIYQVSHASMGFLSSMDIDDILSPAPVNVPINRLTRLSVHRGGESREYEVSMTEKILPNNQHERDEAGNLLYEPTITVNGQEADSTAILREYLRLMALRASGKLPEGFASEEEQAARYQLSGPFGELELALYPFDALHYAMRVNGQFIHYVDRDAADIIQL